MSLYFTHLSNELLVKAQHNGALGLSKESNEPKQISVNVLVSSITINMSVSILSIQSLNRSRPHLV